jgi:hypothetical protein
VEGLECDTVSCFGIRKRRLLRKGIGESGREVVVESLGCFDGGDVVLSAADGEEGIADS